MKIRCSCALRVLSATIGFIAAVGSSSYATRTPPRVVNCANLSSSISVVQGHITTLQNLLNPNLPGNYYTSLDSVQAQLTQVQDNLLSLTETSPAFMRVVGGNQQQAAAAIAALPALLQPIARLYDQTARNQPRLANAAQEAYISAVGQVVAAYQQQIANWTAQKSQIRRYIAQTQDSLSDQTRQLNAMNSFYQANCSPGSSVNTATVTSTIIQNAIR